MHKSFRSVIERGYSRMQILTPLQNENTPFFVVHMYNMILINKLLVQNIAYDSDTPGQAIRCSLPLTQAIIRRLQLLKFLFFINFTRDVTYLCSVLVQLNNFITT